MRVTHLLAVLSLAAGCTPDYPLDKPGTWSLDTTPSANLTNLRAQVADPRDLAAGQPETTSLGAEAAPPITKLLSGHRAPLPSSDLIQLQLGGEPTPTPANGNP